MANLEKLVHDSYENLFNTDKEGTIYDDPSHVSSLMPPRIVDENTLTAIDVKELFNAVNHTKTRTGAATLFRSLIRPLDSLELILEKQNSLKELEKDASKAEALTTYLNTLAQKEPYMHRYLLQCIYCQDEPYNMRFINQYELYRESTDFFKRMIYDAKNLHSLESPYVKVLVEDIQSIDGKRVFDLIKGPVYKTLRGLKTKKEAQLYTPRIKFTLRSLKPTLTIPYAALLVLVFFPPWQLLAPLGLVGYTPILYGLPQAFDKRYFVSPLREIYREDSDVSRGIEALGMLDELLSFHEYSKAMGKDTVLPTVTDADTHHFVARKLRNPILAKTSKDFVSNDVDLKEQRLTIITGANSGGKTTYCKTIAQAQLLAQIGCYVPAEDMEASIADRILYQAPTFSAIMDSEGRFGTELKRTKDIFLKATPKSLIILDELAEATTYEEKMEISYDILNGFNKIRSNTILVTHNHELARRLEEEGKSQNLQVEFKNNKPTYRITPGVSKESHAAFIAEKIGFSPHDIDEHLRTKGYT